jgi:hypothetical protein
MYVEAGKIAQEATKKLSDINGATLVLMPQPISRSMVPASHTSGETPVAVTDREQMCESTFPLLKFSFITPAVTDRCDRVLHQSWMEFCFR